MDTTAEEERQAAWEGMAVRSATARRVVEEAADLEAAPVVGGTVRRTRMPSRAAIQGRAEVAPVPAPGNLLVETARRELS